MDHKLKRKWCAALREGTWGQMFGTYARGNARCALGVLAEVKNPALPPEESLQGGDITPRDWDRIVYMNDALRKPFTEIADWIEENL